MGAYEYAGSQETSPTTIALTPSAYQLNAGNNLTLTAKLISPNRMPTGTVSLFEDGTLLGASTIDGTGSAGWTVNSMVPGIHSFLATYPGQGSFTAAVSVKIYVLVNKYGVTLTLTSSPNPSLVGQPVTFNIKISSPDGLFPGPVALADGSVNIASLTPDTSGNASITTSSLALGSHYMTASFLGDATHLAGQAQVVQQVIDRVPVTMTLVSSLNPATLGQLVKFTATATSTQGVPVGSVYFSDGGISLGTQTLSNGAAAYSTNSLTAGSHFIVATFEITGSYGAGWAALTEIIKGQSSTTALTATPGAAYAQQLVSLNATVKGAGGMPTGSVTFSDGGLALGNAALNASGVAVLQYAFPATGGHTLTATYSGDGTFDSSTSAAFAENVLINTSSTQISTSPSTMLAFQTINLSAQVLSPTGASFLPVATPNGMVTFYDGLNNLGSAALNNGGATLSVSTMQAGSHLLTAVYAGNVAFQSSSSSSLGVTAMPDSTTIAVTANPNPAVVGTAVTFVASVSALAVPLGLVTFLADSSPLGNSLLDSKGIATLTTTSLAVGTYSITASYAGTPNFTGSISIGVKQTILPCAGDFAITVTPAIRSLYTGEAARYSVSLAANGGWNQDVTLSCGPLPANTTCAFTPSTVAGATDSDCRRERRVPPVP